MILSSIVVILPSIVVILPSIVVILPFIVVIKLYECCTSTILDKNSGENRYSTGDNPLPPPSMYKVKVKSNTYNSTLIIGRRGVILINYDKKIISFNFRHLFLSTSVNQRLNMVKMFYIPKKYSS